MSPIFKGTPILWGFERGPASWFDVQGIPRGAKIRERRRADDWVKVFVRHPGKAQMGFIEILPGGGYKFRPVAVNAVSIETRKPIAYQVTEEKQ